MVYAEQMVHHGRRRTTRHSHRKSDVCTPKGNIDGSLVKTLSHVVVFNYEVHQNAVIGEKV